MANKYTEAQAKATRKYQSKTVAIQIRVTEEQRDRYKKEADNEGVSLSRHIINRLEEEKQMIVRLKDERDRSFEIEGLENILKYLGYTEDLDYFDVKDRLNEENAGMAGYYIETE